MEINELITYLLTPVAQIALIMALAQLAKGVGVPSKWIPLVDLGLGLLSGILIYTVTMGYHPAEGILVGLALGLSACGLFSGIKNLTQTKTN
ncbi:hypothetical protein [Megamonas hypermegale]|uniref:hypothetical protein n=1 Tax=Megamonas hypermegale TaxID=158847 RepID=UPI0026EE22D0|nr:hypothetical protein [Megamonas hypermegale]